MKSQGRQALHERLVKKTYCGRALALMTTVIVFFTFLPIAHSAAPPGEWWNSHYGLSKKITLTAGSTDVPGGYSVSFNEDTATLITNSKLRSDGNDWRVVYWNGSSWVELDRWVSDIIGDGWSSANTTTWFKTQAGITASSSDDNYYVYYGYSGETQAAPAYMSDSMGADVASNVFWYADDFEEHAANTDPDGWTDQGTEDFKVMLHGSEKWLQAQTSNAWDDGSTASGMANVGDAVWSAKIYYHQTGTNNWGGIGVHVANGGVGRIVVVRDGGYFHGDELFVFGPWTANTDIHFPIGTKGRIELVTNGTILDAYWYNPSGYSPEKVTMFTGYSMLPGTGKLAVYVERPWTSPGNDRWIDADDMFVRQYVSSEPTFELGPEADSCPVVTNTVDSGPGSLRACIDYANLNAGTTIVFDIPDTDPGYTTSGSESWWRISPTSALPTITGSGTIIDGTTQAANYGSDTNNLGPEVEIDGSGAGAGIVGFTVTGGSSAIRGLVINRFGGDGIYITTNGFNNIQGNYIGTDVTGTVDLGNGDEGVDVRSNNNTIGGTATSDRNVISGNADDGITLELASASDNFVVGNYIGINSTGDGSIANSANGVSIKSGASGNTIGGTAAGAGNVISGNATNGIAIRNAGTTGSIVQGNLIGTNAAGTGAVANGGDGVQITDGAQTTTVGGTTAAGRNVISGNTGDGLQITDLGTSSNTVSGNYIGTAINGTSSIPNGGWGVTISLSAQNNTIGGIGVDEGNIIAFNAQDGIWVSGTDTDQNPIWGNSIHSNGGLGIDLAPDGVNANDSGDGDADPNDMQNYPVITTAVTSAVSTTITGTLNSASGTVFRLEFFSNTTPDPLSYGEGESFLGTATVTTDGTGDASFTVNFPVPLVPGAYVTATATDPVGNTSEFAANFVVLSSCPTVTTTADSGAGSLRECIDYANINPGTTVVFDIPDTAPGYTTSGSESWWRISPTSALPVITASGTIIDGTTQAANYGTDTNSLGPEIEIYGSGAGAGVDGLAINVPGGNATIRYLVVDNFSRNGILLQGGSTLVAGNYLGLEPDGDTLAGNNTSSTSLQGGIRVESAGNTIGGTTAADRNVISGNTLAGIVITGAGATGNQVLGNYIGLDAGGTLDRGNTNDGEGIEIELANSNTIGGTSAGARNVISGNASDGIEIDGSSFNVVQGNYIGTDYTGTVAIPNDRDGIDINSDGATGSTGNVIGGTAAGAGNLIRGNTLNGVELRDDTVVGSTTNNSILGNLIYENGQLGIDLEPVGVTANDSGDGDTGPNGLQNYPVITAVVSGGVSTTVSGTLNSQPTTTYWLEFYSTSTPDPLGYGEGESFLGTTTVTTDGAGDASFSVNFPTAVPLGDYITATATDPAGSTSEFAANAVVPLALVKQAILASDGSLISNSSTLPRGTVFRFLIYTDNTGPARSDVSIRDVLDPAFAYSAGSLKVDNSAAVGSSVAAIYAAVNGTAPLSDVIDADVVSVAGSTIDVGNQFVANSPLDIAANRIWALLFTVRMQ